MARCGVIAAHRETGNVPARQRDRVAGMAVGTGQQPSGPAGAVIAVVIAEEQPDILPPVAPRGAEHLGGRAVIGVAAMDRDALRHGGQRAVPVGKALVAPRQVKLHPVDTVLRHERLERRANEPEARRNGRERNQGHEKGTSKPGAVSIGASPAQSKQRRQSAAH